MLNLTRLFNQTSFKNRFFLNLEKFGAAQSLHTTKISFQSEEPQNIPAQRGKKQERPVDWLPFQWQRKARFNIFEQSGDKIRHIECDPSLPKPDFELSDELKTASESVKHMFSVATASVPEVKEVLRRQIVKQVQRHPLDFDSLEVKIALRTVQIRGLYDHCAKFGRTEIRNSRVILPIMIQRRNKMLKHLREIDNDRFVWLLEALQLYYNPQPLMLQDEKYTKKRDLRRLTKEYCQKMVAEKKAAYHESLKKERESFLEEKKETLALIEEEEKAIEALKQKVESLYHLL